MALKIETEIIAHQIGEALVERLIPVHRPHTFCEHLHSGPQPFYATSASPGAFLCGVCFRTEFSLRGLEAHEETQTKCDVCLTDTGTRHGLHPVQVTAGFAILIASICDQCLETAGDQSSEAAGDAWSTAEEGSPVMILAPRRNVT